MVLHFPGEPWCPVLHPLDTWGSDQDDGCAGTYSHVLCCPFCSWCCLCCPSCPIPGGMVVKCSWCLAGSGQGAAGSSQFGLPGLSHGCASSCHNLGPCCVSGEGSHVPDDCCMCVVWLAVHLMPMQRPRGCGVRPPGMMGCLGYAALGAMWL